MIDQIVESPLVGVPVAAGPTLESAVGGLSRDLRRDLKERGHLTLNELLNKVYDWEQIHGEKLSEQDFEVLSILSMVLGTTKLVLDKKVGATSVSKSTLLESARAQQDILRTVLSNLGEDGRPNRGVVKSLALAGEIFEGYFNPRNPKIDTAGVETEAGLWQAVQGLMTTAFLFREAGWEIKLPPPELDVDYGVDLIARDPDGKVYTVDVTAWVPWIIDKEAGKLSEPFFLEKEGIPPYFPPELTESVNGRLRINVPPLKHHASQGFYEDRVSGYPHRTAVNKFMQMLNI